MERKIIIIGKHHDEAISALIAAIESSEVCNNKTILDIMTTEPINMPIIAPPMLPDLMCYCIDEKPKHKGHERPYKYHR